MGYLVRIDYFGLTLGKVEEHVTASTRIFMAAAFYAVFAVGCGINFVRLSREAKQVSSVSSYEPIN